MCVCIYIYIERERERAFVGLDNKLYKMHVRYIHQNSRKKYLKQGVCRAELKMNNFPVARISGVILFILLCILLC